MTTPDAAAAPKRGAEFRNYPFLSHEEFSEVCHAFDRTYRQATLGPLRRRWRVSACMAFNTTSYATGPGIDYTTYLQISRPLENPAGEHDDELSGVLDKFSFGGSGVDSKMDNTSGAFEEDEAMIAAEDADEAALQPARTPNYGFVTYEIHMHPTYRAPCLWFSLHSLPNDEPAFSIDTVFRHLVPPQFQEALRSMGSIGGISADYHPITGVPSFFVHPCLIGEAMSNFDCTKKNYIMVWLGLVGGCVGLWVPKEMALL